MLLSRKRPHSPDEQGLRSSHKGTALSGGEHSCGGNCGNYITYVLESESPVPTDEDSESVNSIQRAGTASAKDTSDTSWSGESVTMDVEFEEYDVQSLAHSDEKLMSNCDSSGSNDMLCTAAATVLVAAKLHEDRDIWADSSDMADSSDSSDSEVPRADYWECVHCKSKCTPLFRCCLKCFRLRKGYFPERPKRRHPRLRKAGTLQQGTVPAKSTSPLPDADRVLSPTNKSPEVSVGALTKGDSGISMGTLEDKCTTDNMSSVQSTSQELMGDQDSAPTKSEEGERFPSKYQGIEPDPRSELCFMCVERPKNGAFIHKKTVHILSCYRCSLEVWNRTRMCPLCNKRSQNVARIFYG